MNIFFTQQRFLKPSISLLLITFFLSVTLTFADEPAKAALPENSNAEKVARIKKLQHLSLEDLQKVPIINQQDKSQSLSELKNQALYTCSSKSLGNKCK